MPTAALVIPACWRSQSKTRCPPVWARNKLLTEAGVWEDDAKAVKTLICFGVWCLLFVVSWPLAILALIVFPVVWLVSLPFRLVAGVVEAIIALVGAVLMLPARLLGWRSKPRVSQA